MARLTPTVELECDGWTVECWVAGMGPFDAYEAADTLVDVHGYSEAGARGVLLAAYELAGR